MTPAILLFLLLALIHSLSRFVSTNSYTGSSANGKNAHLEVFVPISTNDTKSILNSVTITLNKYLNSLFITILDREYTTKRYVDNSLEYPKTTDGLVYLTD